MLFWPPSQTERKKKEAMIARFDHRPMLTALLALSTIVLVVVVITLSTLLITSPQAASPRASVVTTPARPRPPPRMWAEEAIATLKR